MRDAAHGKARKNFLDSTVFVLEAAQFQRIIEILDAPLTRSQKIAVNRLLLRKAPWER